MPKGVSTMAEPVSVRAFAKLDGGSHTPVSKAIKRGNLPVTANSLIDPALAGTGWRKWNRVETQGGNTAAVSAPAAEVETPKRQRGKAGALPVEASGSSSSARCWMAGSITTAER